MMKNVIGLLVSCLLINGMALADMAFVTVGTPENDNDSTGFGAVGYTYQIGQFEVSIEQFAAFTSATGIGSATGAAGTPAVNLDWDEAAMFCNWMSTGFANQGAYSVAGGVVTGMMTRAQILADGNLVYVLPTVNEWYKAAYFSGGVSNYSLYAFGENSAPSAGTNANYNNVNIGPWALGSGEFEQNNTKDMMGNVYEWTQSDENTPDSRQVVLGGSYATGSQSMKSTTSFIDLDTIQVAGALGFRVVAVPEPGTMSLMGISTIGLFVARKRRRRKLFGGSILPVGNEHFCDAYCSKEEWEAIRQGEDMDQEGSTTLLLDISKASLLPIWYGVKSRYNAANCQFWNFMVVSHERHIVRKKAFKKSVKRGALNAFDVFLARIMK